MSVSPSADLYPVIVTTLRAAGCVFAEDEARLLISAAQTPDHLTTLVDQRVGGLPLEHIVGWAEFCGLRIAVDPGVFVPRRRTAFLVQQAVTLACRVADELTVRPAPVVVDLCCGSGAMGVALAMTLARTLGETLGQVELHAADIEPAAVQCARRNVGTVRGHVYEGDLYEALPQNLRGRVDILVANAPYVPTESVGLMPPEARIHEPRVALDGGTDGLDVLRRVITAAPSWLAPGGHLLFETGARQAPRAVEAVLAAGLTAQVASSDELTATVVIGTRPSH